MDTFKRKFFNISFAPILKSVCILLRISISTFELEPCARARHLLGEGHVDAFVSNERLWGDIPKNHITFSRDLKKILLSHTYEKEIDLLVDG